MKEQKCILFMLAAAQKCPELWIGVFAKLNYDTATAVSENTVLVDFYKKDFFQILKSMYTLSMMLIEMVS